jgi:hypothetical protein
VQNSPDETSALTSSSTSVNGEVNSLGGTIT